MASEFITRVERDKDEPYTVIFHTDDADKYKHIEDECRRMIGHEKPTADAVPIDFLKQFAEGKRGYYSDFVIEAVKSYRERENHAAD